MLRITRLTLLLSLAIGAAACDDDDDDGAAPPANANLNTLSGKIAAPGGAGLPGATIRFQGTETTTNANGLFFLPNIGDVPLGTQLVDIDGSTSTAVGTFPELEVMVNVAAGDTDITLPQIITLPDLDSLDAVTQTVTVDVNGATDADFTLMGPDGDIELDLPTGTIITLGGVPAAAPVDVNVTPVPNDEVPMPLPTGLQGSAFVTIQPGNAAFDADGMGAGLDVLLPNDGNVPIGTMVDVWSFDHDVGDWVNRSAETGNQGVVEDLGGGLTGIRASGVITEGGWHAGVIAVDTDCVTTLTGQVVDDMMNGLGGVSVFTDLGQFTTTASDGTFTLESVPAYELGVVPCTTTDVTVTAAAPPILGAVESAGTTILAADVMAGATTTVPDITLTIPTTGCVSGVVLGEDNPENADVTITGPTNTTATPQPNGSFFTCDLDPGSYTASYLFTGESVPTEVSFDIAANEVTTIVLQLARGTGSETITVNVVEGDGAPFPTYSAVDGALVLLRGTDSGSSAGLVQMTDAMGQATFENVDGPYDVTAVSEALSQGQFPGTVFRNASTLLQIDPAADQIGVLLGLGNEDGPASPTADATVSGTLSNVPAGCTVSVIVTNREYAGEDPTFENATFGETASYSLAVPSGQILDLFFEVDCSGTPDGAGFVLAVPALTPAEDRTVDFDFAGTSYATFGTSVGVSATGLSSPGTSDFFVEALLRETTEQIEAGVEVFEGLATDLPISVPLPDLAAAPANLFDTVAIGEAGYDFGNTFRFQCQDQRLSSTPAGITFDMVPAASLASPAAPVQLDPGTEAGTTFSYTIPGGTNGVNLFQIRGPGFFGDSGAEGLSTSVNWTIWGSAGTSSITIPPLPQSILDTGSYLGLFEGVRFTGVTTSLNDLFDENVGSNISSALNNFTTLQAGGVEFGIDVGTQQP